MEQTQVAAVRVLRLADPQLENPRRDLRLAAQRR